MKIFLPIMLLFLLVSCEKDEKVITYKLTTEIDSAKGGSVSPSSGEFDEGEEINLTATPAEGYDFIKWTGAISSTENPIGLVVTSDKTIIAVFEKIDNDKDGVADDIDQCLETPEGEQVDSQGCSESQKDADGDGITDDLDQCAETPEGDTVDEQGCSDTQKDSDSDGITDDLDQCSETPEGETVDEDGCSETQKDTDNDGVTDDLDQCPETLEGETVGEDGCSDSQKDTDNDGVTDDLDQCPETPEGETVGEDGCTLSLNTYVPDDQFERELISRGYDDVLDDYVVTSNISSIEQFYLGGVKDLTGLEDFVSLKSFHMSGVYIPSHTFNTADFPNLTVLGLDFSELKSIIVNENSKIESLNIVGYLDTLLVTNNSTITSIAFEESYVRSVIVSGNSNLLTFGVGDDIGTTLREITLTDNPSLKFLGFGLLNVDHLNMSNNPLIESFHASGMSNLPFDLSALPNLKSLRLDEIGGVIDVSSNSSLESLYLFAAGNNGQLDLSNNSALKILELYETGQEQLDLSNNSALETLTLHDNGLEQLDLSNNSALETLTFYDKGLEQLDLSYNSALRILSISGTGLEQLDVSNNTLLEKIELYFNTNLACIRVNQQQLENIPSTWKLIGSTTEYALDCPD